jgi:hypothetical protein
VKLNKIIQVCHPTYYYGWQTAVWLDSLRSIGLSEKAVSILYYPKNTFHHKIWERLMEYFSEASFYIAYVDIPEHEKIVYPPIIRPYCLEKYYSENNIEGPVLYTDCDVFFTDKFNVDNVPYSDKVAYLSDTNSYINFTYLFNKGEKAKKGLGKIVVGELARMTGISLAKIIYADKNSGGAQYIFPTLNREFWEKVKKLTLDIYLYLSVTNTTYFKSQEDGYQAWCADMWAVLYSLLYYGIEPKVIPELDFAHGTDSKIKKPDVPIVHIAGVVNREMNIVVYKNLSGIPVGEQKLVPLFKKTDFVAGNNKLAGGDPSWNPIENDHSKRVLENPDSKTFWSTEFLERLVALSKKINLSP